MREVPQQLIRPTQFARDDGYSPRDGAKGISSTAVALRQTQRYLSPDVQGSYYHS